VQRICGFGGECFGALGLPDGPLTDDQVAQVLEWLRSKSDSSAASYQDTLHKAFEMLWPGK
jgi:hypothetical protein